MAWTWPKGAGRRTANAPMAWTKRRSDMGCGNRTIKKPTANGRAGGGGTACEQRWGVRVWGQWQGLRWRECSGGAVGFVGRVAARSLCTLVGCNFWSQEGQFCPLTFKTGQHVNLTIRRGISSYQKETKVGLYILSNINLLTPCFKGCSYSQKYNFQYPII